MDRTLIVIIALGVLMAAVLPIALFLYFQPPPVTGDLALVPIMEGLDFPVSLAFSPDGRLFYNELKEGGLRIIANGELLDQPLVSLPVAQVGEVGLLGLALDPDFASQPYVYVYYTYEKESGTSNRISRFEVQENIAGDEDILMDDIPASDIHNSGQLRFGLDGMLYASVGDTRDRDEAQDPASLKGKILRMNRDGTLPGDNPFPGSYAYLIGIRNVFGMDFTPDGLLLFTENGPEGNDEVNVGRAGRNYGWPDVEGIAGRSEYEDPVVVFSPAIAPTGLAYRSGNSLGSERPAAIYFGSWLRGDLHRLVGDPSLGEPLGTVIEVRADGGILDVEAGPDGHLYVTTSSAIYQVVLVPSDEQPQGSPTSFLNRLILYPSRKS